MTERIWGEKRFWEGKIGRAVDAAQGRRCCGAAEARGDESTMGET